MKQSSLSGEGVARPSRPSNRAPRLSSSKQRTTAFFVLRATPKSSNTSRITSW